MGSSEWQIGTSWPCHLQERRCSWTQGPRVFIFQGETPSCRCLMSSSPLGSSLHTESSRKPAHLRSTEWANVVQISPFQVPSDHQDSVSWKETSVFPSARWHKLTTLPNPVFMTWFLSTVPPYIYHSANTAGVYMYQVPEKQWHCPCTHSPSAPPHPRPWDAGAFPVSSPQPLGIAWRSFLELTLLFIPTFPVLQHPSPLQLSWHLATAP